VVLVGKKLEVWRSAVAHQERLSARRGLDATIAQAKAFSRRWPCQSGHLVESCMANSRADIDDNLLFLCAITAVSRRACSQENPDKLHHHAKHTTVVATSFSSHLDPSTYQFPKPTMIHIEMKAREVEESIGYIFSDRRIAVEAVQMAAPQVALIHNGAFLGLNNNKRLSVLGDAVLAKVLCGAWFDARNPSGKKRFPQHMCCGVLKTSGQVLSQAQWTQMRNESLSNDALARRAHQVGLDECIITADSKPVVSPKNGGHDL